MFELNSILIHHDSVRIRWLVRRWVKKLAGDVVALIKKHGGPDGTDELKNCLNQLKLISTYSGRLEFSYLHVV